MIALVPWNITLIINEKNTRKNFLQSLPPKEKKLFIEDENFGTIYIKNHFHRKKFDALDMLANYYNTKQRYLVNLVSQFVEKEFSIVPICDVELFVPGKEVIYRKTFANCRGLRFDEILKSFLNDLYEEKFFSFLVVFYCKKTYVALITGFNIEVKELF